MYLERSRGRIQTSFTREMNKEKICAKEKINKMTVAFKNVIKIIQNKLCIPLKELNGLAYFYTFHYYSIVTDSSKLKQG